MAVVPYEVSNRKPTDVVVEYQGKRSPAVTLDVVARTPALFTLDSSGKGQAAILNETGCCNSARNPAARGARDGWWRARSDRLMPTPHAVAGQLQVNFWVPANAPIGDAVPITLTVGHARSPDGVTVAVRSRSRCSGG